jgi:hypothetical protein
MQLLKKNDNLHFDLLQILHFNFGFTTQNENFHD